MPGYLDTKIYSSRHPLLLRIVEPRDAPALAAMFSDPANVSDDPSCSPEPMTVAAALRMIDEFRLKASTDVPQKVNLLILRLDEQRREDAVLGITGFGGFDNIPNDGDKGTTTTRFADVGVMLNPPARGKGYALEAIRLSVEFAFERLPIDAVSCQTLVRNVAMVGLAEKKLGWTGVRSLHKNGDLAVRYEIWPRQWAAMREA